jgi:RNA polymerase sigma-70 factor (ECF subfamily)
VGRSHEPHCFNSALAAARAGDGRGHEHLFRSLAPRIAGFLRAGGSSDPDGLVNEVFLRVFGQLDRFEGDESALRAWAFSIARCRLIDERRTAARRIAAEQLCEHHHDVLQGDVAADADVGLGTEWVTSVLALLGPDQRDVLTLRIVGDLPFVEIAAVLGKSVGAVKALQRRGLATVRRTFELTDEEIAGLAVPF